MNPLQFSPPLPDVDVIPYTIVDPRLEEPVAVDAVDGATSYLNVVVGVHRGWRPLRVDVHLPAGGAGPFPVVVYAHGGAFVGGVKEMGPWSTLPSQGIAVVSVEYRLAGEARYPEPVEDVVSVVRWVRAVADRYGFDPQRVAGWGSSAGGYLMGRAAVSDGVTGGRPIPELREHSAQLAAVVLHYAPTDLTDMVDLARRDPLARDQVEASIELLYGRTVEAPDLPAIAEHGSVVRAAASAEHLPAFLLAHGDADRTVPLEQSERLQRAILAHGGRCELTVVPGEEHAAEIFASPTVVAPAGQFLFDVWATSPASDVTA